jgi:hypothetical protein
MQKEFISSSKGFPRRSICPTRKSQHSIDRVLIKARHQIAPEPLRHYVAGQPSLHIYAGMISSLNGLLNRWRQQQ